MADIFLSYRGSHSLIEPFETNLERQGHNVYSDDDFDYRLDTILAKLPEFDAVIVIWSDLSPERDALSFPNRPEVKFCDNSRVVCASS